MRLPAKLLTWNSEQADIFGGSIQAHWNPGNIDLEKLWRYVRRIVVSGFVFETQEENSIE
jgi:hypothetical protein